MQSASSPTQPDHTVTLHELQQLINEADQMASRNVASIGAQIRICVEAGMRLAAFRKTLGHGKWMNWFSENVSGITDQTARNWMKLAEAHAKGQDFSSAKSIRQAYQLAGVLPGADEQQQGKQGDGVTYLIHADRLLHALGQIEVGSLTGEQRQQLAERLKPVATLYASLCS